MRIHLTIVFKDDDEVTLECQNWNMLDNGALHIIESDHRVRLIAPRIWLEVIGTRIEGS